LTKYLDIAEQYNYDGQIVDVQEYGTGNVNDTFLVTLSSDQDKHFILQRINTRVFKKPELIMVNMLALSEHVLARLKHESEREHNGSERGWEVPRVLTTKGGKAYFIDAAGAFWRAMSFIDRSTAYPKIRDAHHAREAGYALGRFQSLISDMDTAGLHDTLEGFHITPRYLRHYDEVLAGCNGRVDSVEVKHCLKFVAQRTAWAAVLEDARSRGELQLRPIHGDPKVDNIMIDNASGRAVSIIDLDTVKPGLVHYDVGDCLRSCCNLLGEETDKIGDVCFETDMCREILQGYLSMVRGFFTPNDYAYLFDCMRLIAFELGLRFFTDHLEGNVYFKAKHREHNLMRALVQFQLAASIEAQEGEIRAIINDLK
jgi:Ser/Thr protein kinase RdoA (MazF antagonist)